MICENNSDLIDDLVEDELDEPLAARVNSHVFACLKCRARYDALRREKEIYARYLFDAEPPNDLWVNFQAKLESEKEKTVRFAEKSAPPNNRKANIFAFLPLSPVFAGAALLIIFGIGFWLKLIPDESGNYNHAAMTESDNSEISINSLETNTNVAADSPVKISSGDDKIAAKKSRLADKTEFTKTKNVFAAVKKPSIAEVAKVSKKIDLPDAKRNTADKNETTKAERLQRLAVFNLENEIVGQIEKVELLLRSFRNARTFESDETFDVGYEKGQARKLLEKNVRLRRRAENYGIDYAENLLNRVEPYLLDIANLEDKPAPDTVLDIRERVKNQSIIASLQIY